VFAVDLAGSDDARLHSVDVSGVPSVLDTLVGPSLGIGEGVVLSGGTALVSYWQGFRNVDVSNPSSLSFGTTVTNATYSAGGQCAFDGSVLATAMFGNDTVALWDVVAGSELGAVTSGTYLSQVEDVRFVGGA